jgi:CheY-like chemotaxis protein
MAGGGVIHVLGENLILGHTPDSGVEEGSYVRICVVDSGCGIPEKHLSKIFDPFFTTKEKGRGLGLATAYSILRRHGGHIRVSSKVGVGSRVDIYLPASQKTSVSEGPTKLELARGKGRVLLIDDDEFVRRSAQEILKRLGCEVESAGDGEEGIRLYERARESGRAFCAVIMDLTIHGGMGGKGAAQKLLELDPQARVIVSSGYSNDPVMSQFREYGFSGVLAKPYRIEELAEAIQLALAGKEE